MGESQYIHDLLDLPKYMETHMKINQSTPEDQYQSTSMLRKVCETKKINESSSQGHLSDLRELPKVNENT